MAKKAPEPATEGEPEGGTLGSLVRLLVPLVAAEFGLLRIVMRMGHGLPQSAAVRDAVQWLFLVGEVAFNAAFLVSILALALVAVSLVRWGGVLPYLSTLIFAVLLTGLLFHLTPSPAVSLAYGLLSFVLLALATLSFGRGDRGRAIFLVSVTLVYLSSYYYKAASSLAALGLGPLPMTSEVFSMGEAGAVVGAGLAFLAFRPRRSLAGAAAATFVSAVFLVAASRMVVLPLLTTWAVYFTLHLPAPVYALALWLYVYTLADLLRNPARRRLAYGLILIAFGGRMLEVTYLNQLAVLGFLLLSAPSK